MIPKIIHYCWFGRGEFNPLLKSCMASWDKLKKAGYVVKEWNESNCNLDENEYVRKMYDNKRYAFVSDYFRLKALYEEGGIYFDTDVYVYKSFNDLLDCEFFIGYIFDCALGTAVIGASKGSKIIKALLDQYYDLKNEEINNNGLFTDFFYDKVKGFNLNGKRSSILYSDERIEIFPKEEFECGRILGRSYCIHFADNSWVNGAKRGKVKLKLFCNKLPFNILAFRRIQHAKKYLKGVGKYQEWYRKTNRDK